MPAQDINEQLQKYLTDVHAIERQALAQMESAPKIAGEPALSGAFSAHLTETQQHEQLIRSRLQARGGEPAIVKDLAGTLTGKGFVAFARVQPDTPGKLAAHAYSYEHMELAAYVLLGRVAQMAGDAETVDVARQICEQEQQMGDRLESLFDVAAEASLRGVGPEALGQRLDGYLEDAHAIEVQALRLLDRARAIAGHSELASACAAHLEETEDHERLVAARLRARSASPSRLKDAAMRVGALNWGAFFQLQPDTPAKLAAFAYAFEHLEIAGYELLGRVAARAGDAETEELVRHVLDQERAAAERLRGLMDTALDASLRQVGAAA
jgi:ferritin-like metal-binding protein YciE